MYYKITWLTLRFVPAVPVNREEFYGAILKSLGFDPDFNKFVFTCGDKCYFNIARYHGINIKLPFYETMNKQGFVLEITEEGMDFLVSRLGCNSAELIEGLFDIFLNSAYVTVPRIDIETDYISKKILKFIPKDYTTVYIGSAKSDFYCIHSMDKNVYTSRHRVASVMVDEILCCNDTEYFKNSLKCFLDDWKPHTKTVFSTLIAEEPCPPSATK